MSTAHGGHPATRSSGGQEPWTIRPIVPDELHDFRQVGLEAMLMSATPGPPPEVWRPLIEPDRTLAAFDGARIVGTTLAHRFSMTLPGGPRPVAGVSAVGVRPTHRRRGVLSALMRRQLADLREHGEAVAALFASEGGIYGRFGYGAASSGVSIRIGRGEGALRADAPRDPALRLRLTAPEDAAKELAVVHEATMLQRPGTFARDERWWRRILADPEETRGGFGAHTCVLVEDGAGPLGYALYRVRPGWDDYGVAAGELQVKELYATAPAAYAMLWEHVLQRDLVATVTADLRPPDDPLYHLLADYYRARTVVSDALWIRLVDLPRALEQRAYSAPVDVVVEVTDTAGPWNAGRWRLSADPRGAACERTEREPDLRLDVADLGAAYLGGIRLGALAAAGRVTEIRDHAVAELDAALSWPLHPHCGVIF
ncbi:GNAT family N-acetyltransferase [Marinactinospora rubrisoli]|uniref:GNAT family N-acetyltransferase n=1 Tax=Marinactinospora rubrisoli TaxID=2715399 RepID=A0ABW2KI02_9ACTN